MGLDPSVNFKPWALLNEDVRRLVEFRTPVDAFGEERKCIRCGVCHLSIRSSATKRLPK
jgi:hypothetical protein